MYERLWGVYEADGGLVGEIAYVLGKIRGTAHCALCDITHGALRKKPDMRELEADLGIPLHLVHLNERPASLRDATRGRTPCVAGERDGAYDILLDRDALEECRGSVARFRRALRAALEKGVGENGSEGGAGSDGPDLPG